MTKQDAENYINDIPRFTEKNGPENTERLMALLGNPERRAKTVHVAGTNGKGSVSKMMSLLLQEAGFKTGLFISPHLVDITERISINEVNISDEDFGRIAGIVKETSEKLVAEGGAHPAYFEFIFAMAAIYFAEQGAEYVVYETGLGGRLDATNCITPVMTSITEIGLDHMQYLGDTIEKIAAEKAGIIKKGVPLVYYTGSVEANKVLVLRACEMGCPAFNACWTDKKIKSVTAGRIDFSLDTRYYKYDDLVLNTGAAYQVKNAASAVYMFDRLFHDMDIEERYRIIKDGLARFRMPGRLEFVKENIILDGAHNEDAAKELMSSLKELYGNLGRGKFRLLFAVSSDKDYRTVASILCRDLKLVKVYMTKVHSGRGLETDKEQEVFGNLLRNRVALEAYQDTESAFNAARAELMDDEVLICTGSLYLVGELKELLGRI